jgi:Undecaprenyl-phosphate glucose phosphotransferase
MTVDTGHKDEASPKASSGQSARAEAARGAAADAIAPQEQGGLGQARIAKLAEPLNEGHARPAYSLLVLAGLARLGEFAIICATGLAGYTLYIFPTHGHIAAYYYAIASMAVLAVLVFQAARIYSIEAFRTPGAHLLRLAGGWVVVFLVAMAALFFLKRGMEFSRIWLLGWFVSGFAALVLNRIYLYLLVVSLTRRGRLDRRAVVVGSGLAAEQLLQELSSQSYSSIKIYGVFDDRSDERSPDVVAGYPKLGNVDDLVEFARHTRIDLIVFALPISAERRILEMLRKLWVLPIDIRLAAHSNKLQFRPRTYSYVGSVPLLPVFDKPMADWDVVMKMAFDRIVGAVCLILLSPLMLITAIAVKLDSPGPVLFKQKRHGFNNEKIDVYKFRSMHNDKLDYTAVNQVKKNDPRVTRVGRIIRKTSIDELPQLFNVVFKGNLSLVGPRPHAVQARAADLLYDEVVDGYFARHRVRPGMTGWVQVNGWRGETDTPEKLQRRVEHDLYYIENWSMLFDLYILALTPFALTKTENAY